MLCFVVNRIKKLERLQLLKVLFDKSLESKEITLRPKAFHFLAELNLSHSSGLEDRSFVKLFDEVQNLQVLNCMNTRMALFPNLIRRFYQNYDDLQTCWAVPTIFGFTLTIVRALITFVACELKQIYLGPNVCLDNVIQLMQLENLQEVHLLFPTRSDATKFEEKVLALVIQNGSNKKFHYHSM